MTSGRQGSEATTHAVVLPSAERRGWLATALLPALAGQVRGRFHNEETPARAIDSSTVRSGASSLNRVGIFHTIECMATRAVKKTISLPAELARELEDQARAERKTLSGVVQDALWKARRGRLRTRFRQMQSYWSEMAKEKGILSERDLERYLSQ